MKFSGEEYYAHRIAWKLYYGVEPPLIIDHVDGDGHNNKIDNLEEVTNAENIQRGYKRKIGGYGSIVNSSNGEAWYPYARNKTTDKAFSLGTFKTYEQAQKARTSYEASPDTYHRPPSCRGPQQRLRKGRGYRWSKRQGKWQAYLKADNKHHGLGSFTDEHDAAKAVQIGRICFDQGHDIIHARWAVKQVLKQKDTT